MSINVEPNATKTGSAFEVFVATDCQRLRRALTARFGVEVGNEVTNDALAHAWSRWDAVEAMANPVGYLYRVAQSAARPHWRWRQRVSLVPADPSVDAHHIDGDVFTALSRLRHEQRVAVLLVHGYGYTYREVADLLGVTVAAVTNHVHRGVERLRKLLEERDDRDR